MKTINKILIMLFISACACGNRSSKVPESPQINESAENENVLVSDNIIMTMTMTTNSDKVKIYMAGSGTITIYWGNGRETHSLKDYVERKFPYSSEYEYSHSYSDTSFRTITIIGENITHLDCWYYQNKINELDVSKNPKLEYLDCRRNQLISLDISNNIELMKLDCGYNQLAKLDISKNTMLEYLNCWGNLLTSLNVSNNINLTKLDCSDNQLTSLDLSNNINLESLNCGYNQINELDLSRNKNMNSEYLFTEFNPFSNSKSFLDKLDEPKNQTDEHSGNENPIRDDTNSLQLKKVAFAPSCIYYTSASTCSYYTASGKNSKLINNIERTRLSMMKEVFSSYWYVLETPYPVKTNFISDDVKGWNLAKRETERECNRFNKDYSLGCGYDLYAERYYQNTNVISIKYSYHINWCGAHPTYEDIVHSFGKNTGKLISYNQLVRNEAKLSSIAEKQFWKENQKNELPSSTKFEMANKFEFTESGIRFYYDHYEIVGGAWGILEFTIPYADLVGVVNYLETF